MSVRLLLVLPEDQVKRVTAFLEGVEPLIDRLAPDARPEQLVAAPASDMVLVAGEDGAQVLSILEAVRELPDRPDVVVLTETDHPEAHAAWLTAGAMAVLRGDLSDEEVCGALVALIERRREINTTRIEATQASGRDDDFVSASPLMKELLDTLDRLSDARSSVLLLGETGVGKERIASLIHGRSPRANGPFLAVNCAAIPSELVESELFGHEKGSFTGAHRSRRGLFELATAGTLFLDEVGELPHGMQAKLLRALQNDKIRPVGSDREIEIDVRVVAATNRDLDAEMEAGRFRSDLYYRLAVVELHVPPLRDRPEDILVLLEHTLARFRSTFGREVRGFTAEARAALMAHDWPGNVRELINVVERAVLLCLGQDIALGDLPRAIASPRARKPVLTHEDPLPETPPDLWIEPGAGLPLPESWLVRPWKSVREELLQEGERTYLTHLLRACRGKVGLAARRAGLAERSLFEKMKRLGLRKEDFRDPSE